MIFTKRLRDGVRRGEITCSIRIWQRPHVTIGKRYRMEGGEIEIDSILPISFADITPELARESGSRASSTCSRSPGMGLARTCIWCASTSSRKRRRYLDPRFVRGIVESARERSDDGRACGGARRAVEQPNEADARRRMLATPQCFTLRLMLASP